MKKILFKIKWLFWSERRKDQWRGIKMAERSFGGSCEDIIIEIKR